MAERLRPFFVGGTNMSVMDRVMNIMALVAFTAAIALMIA